MSIEGATHEKAARPGQNRAALRVSDSGLADEAEIVAAVEAPAQRGEFEPRNDDGDDENDHEQRHGNHLERATTTRLGSQLRQGSRRAGAAADRGATSWRAWGAAGGEKGEG